MPTTPTPTIAEKASGRSASTGPNKFTVKFQYIVYNATDQNSAVTALAAGTTVTMLGGLLSRQTISATELEPINGTYDGEVVWEFVNAQPKQTGETAFNFDTTGGTAKLTTSLATVASYSGDLDDSDPPDFQGQLNVHDGKVDGVEITVPNLAFTGTRYVQTLSQSYIGQLFHATGTMNAGTWTAVIDGITLSFTEGEALFLGACGSRRGQGDVELSLKYAASETQTNITIGDISGVTKRGWDYLWVFSTDQEVDAGDIKYVAPIPTYVYVEQLYRTSNFSVHGFASS